MKRSLSLTLFLIAGLVLFSIASCGGSNQGEYAKTSAQSNQYAEAEDSYDYDYDYEAELYDVSSGEEEVVVTFRPFSVYTDARSPDNHYVASGYMGDYADIKIEPSCFETPHSGTTCMKITYSKEASQGARWAGVYWQNPANNWGDREGGYDLTGATKLTLWTRGVEGGERIEEFKVGGITGLYSDSDTAGIGPMVLTKEWKQYEIDLRGKDLSYISGGFCWATNLDVNPDGMVFYLDDIRYE